jgi:hypothetical protein
MEVIEYLYKNKLNVRIGSSSKDFKIKNDIPGPGNYDVDLKRTVSSYIIKNDNSKYAHDKLNSNIEITPGPGDYKPKDDIKHHKISYSIRSKNENNKINNNPGPGSYGNLHKQSSAPKFS